VNKAGGSIGRQPEVRIGRHGPWYHDQLQRLQARRARSTSAVGAPDDRRKIAATQAHIPQFPIVKLIELTDLCCCPVACRQSGRKATQYHPDP
jgi:hypothetical protein